RNVHLAQVYEQVFTPERPVCGERVVNTDARGPSHARTALLRDQRGEHIEGITKRQRMADAAKSHSASRVDESAIVGKSHARTQCRKPTVALGKVLHHAKGRQKSGLASILAPPSNVPLKSPDEAADLVIVPGLDPTHQAV